MLIQCLWLTFSSRHKLQVLLVLLNQPLDQVNLLQVYQHRILVLGATGGISNPQLQKLNKISNIFSTMILYNS